MRLHPILLLSGSPPRARTEGDQHLDALEESSEAVPFASPCADRAFMSSAGLAAPSPDLSHEFVDLVRTQKGRLLFQFRTPFHHNLIGSISLVIAFINHLLDGYFPFIKTHRLFLFDFGIPNLEFGQSRRLPFSFAHKPPSVAQ